MRDEDGLEKCVACGLCAVACPADAIYLEAAENDGTVQAGPRYASVYQIHKTRCIFCGYCEEACPVSAIFMGKDYELAVYSKNDFIWDKTDLLVSGGRLTPAARRPLCLVPFLDALDATRARLRRRDGHDAVREGRLRQPLLRVAEPHRAGPGGGGAPGLRAGRRGRGRDEHVRRQPRQARRRSAWPTRSAAINIAGARVARHAARDAGVRGRARSGRSAIRIEPWGKTGVDEAEAFFREQATALLEGRRRPVHPRDVPRPERDGGGHRGGPEPCATCRSSRR